MFKKKIFIMQCVRLALLYIFIYLGVSLIDLSSDRIWEKRLDENETLNFEQKRDIKLEILTRKIQGIDRKITSQNIIIAMLLSVIFMRKICFPDKVETSETKKEDS